MGLDGCRQEWVSEAMDAWMGGWRSEWLGGWIGRWTDGLVDVQMLEWKDG